MRNVGDLIICIKDFQINKEYSVQLRGYKPSNYN